MEFIKKLKIKESRAVFSNIVFLIPLYYAILANTFIHALVIFLVFIFSVLFHYSKPSGPEWWDKTTKLKLYQVVLLWLDTIVANVLIITNLYIFWQKGFPTEFSYAVIFALIGLYIYFFVTKKNLSAAVVPVHVVPQKN